MAKKQAPKKQELTVDELLQTMSSRFQLHLNRHPKSKWKDVESLIKSNEEKLDALLWMESTGGEPDVVELDKKEKGIVIIDCSPESPVHRRSLCYDDRALEERKEFKPTGSAVDMAISYGTQVLDESTYLMLQQFGPFDQKTSSWILTPDSIRKQGGALFGDHRFGRTFIYHNGASSYYAGRAFRVQLTIV
jgi:hypothetical protein